MIGVLIVEDEDASAEALKAYVERVSEFTVTGLARTGADALKQMATDSVDLVLLDIYLPDISGLELLRRMRTGGSTVDVIAVTVARDLSVVRAAVAFGVVQYVIKPFTFKIVRERLERYRTYRSLLIEHEFILARQEIDQLLSTLRDAGADSLSSGIDPGSLYAIVSALKIAAVGLSASEVAQSSGASRVTARRYLEYLVDSGLVIRSTRYGGAGRPEVEYRLLPSTTSDPSPDEL